MKKFYSSLVFILILTTTVKSQNVGIDTSNPQAKLDIVSNNSGILVPRISLSSTTDVSSVTAPDVSELIYNTATNGSGSTAVFPGFYFWNGSNWTPISSNGPDDDWLVDDTNHDLSPVDLTYKVGIGTNAPSNDLHIYNSGSNASLRVENSGSTDNKVYFGSGTSNWIGESTVDDRLELNSQSLVLDINGNTGTDGQVLTSNGTTASWVDGDPYAPISDCSIVGTYNLPIVVYYGSYGYENSWELRSSATPGVGVIISGGGGTNYTTQYNGSVTLNYGQDYWFSAYDSYGDGWNGGGYFNLGSPFNTGNYTPSDYGVDYQFNYQICTETSTQQLIVRGSVQSNGDIIGGGGFSLNAIGNGRYEIIFSTPFTDRPSATVTQIFTDFDSNAWGGSTLDNAIITHLDQNKMRIVTGDGSGTGTDRDFSFIVLGSK